MNNTVISACPFAATACTTQATFSADTGLIDTQVDLGMNMPNANSLLLRKVLTCSPIKSDIFRADLNWSPTWDASV